MRNGRLLCNIGAKIPCYRPKNSLLLKIFSLLACAGNCSRNGCSTGVSCNESDLRGTKIVKFPVKFPVSREFGRRPGSICTAWRIGPSISLCTLIVLAFRVQVFGTFKTLTAPLTIADQLEQMIASLRQGHVDQTARSDAMCAGDDKTCPEFELHHRKFKETLDRERRSFLKSSFAAAGGAAALTAGGISLVTPEMAAAAERRRRSRLILVTSSPSRR